MWKARLDNGRVLTADLIRCTGGALVLASKEPDGRVVDWMVIPPGRWIEATAADPEATAAA
jgi:hypothetical protein